VTKYDQAALKREANEAHAAKFGRRKKKSTRKKERSARVAARELNWLAAHGIERDGEHPLVRSR
jgi:hypothetical protein